MENNIKEGYWIVNTNYGSFLTDVQDFIGNKIFHNHVWEPNILDLYKSILQPHYVVLDIGAHMGFHTINFGFYSKQVYAFEPQLPLYNQLCGNVFLNKLNEKITCFNVGLGETNKKSSFGSLEKHNSLNWDGNWDIELINYGGRSLEDNLEINDIEIKTLDSFNLSPHFIKIDVEGYELKTLQGAKKTLEINYPIILFESFPEYQKDVFKYLETIGYKLITIPNTDLGVDFIAIHPKFEDYLNIKNYLLKFGNVK